MTLIVFTTPSSHLFLMIRPFHHLPLSLHIHQNLYFLTLPFPLFLLNVLLHAPLQTTIFIIFLHPTEIIYYLILYIYNLYHQEKGIYGASLFSFWILKVHIIQSQQNVYYLVTTQIMVCVGLI